jgi:hypothetical protein
MGKLFSSLTKSKVTSAKTITGVTGKLGLGRFGNNTNPSISFKSGTKGASNSTDMDSASEKGKEEKGNEDN